MVELPDRGRLSDEVIDQLLQGARTEEEIAVLIAKDRAAEESNLQCA